MHINNEKPVKILIEFLSTKFLFNHTVFMLKSDQF